LTHHVTRTTQLPVIAHNRLTLPERPNPVHPSRHYGNKTNY
jgi:hypothetical protein